MRVSWGRSSWTIFDEHALDTFTRYIWQSMLVYKRDLCVVIGGYRRAYADSYDNSGKYNCVAEPRQPDWLDSFHCSLFLACGMVFREVFQVEQTSFRDLRQTACDL